MKYNETNLVKTRDAVRGYICVPAWQLDLPLAPGVPLAAPGGPSFGCCLFREVAPLRFYAGEHHRAGVLECALICRKPADKSILINAIIRFAAWGCKVAVKISMGHGAAEEAALNLSHPCN